MRARLSTACLAATCAFAPGCKKRDPGPDLAIVGESTRVRLEDPYPAATPWLHDGKVELVVGIGERIGLQVLHRAEGATTLTVDDPHVKVAAYDVTSYRVTRASTDLYGGGRTGTFPDALALVDGAAHTNPAYFEVTGGAQAIPGKYTGSLTVGATKLPVEVTVVPVTLATPTRRVWAYEDPRELAWAAGAPPTTTATADASPAEAACAAEFAARGVELMPDLKAEWWPKRAPATPTAFRDLPVTIPDDPAKAGDAVRAWIAGTKGTGFVPFAIPIDEPRTPEARAKVVALAKAVRAAGGGPASFRYAVTDEPRPEYGDLVDLYISLEATRGQWTYNGAPPRAGAVVLDALTPGARTWGWIAYRYAIPIWYVWDALYWHDRYNRKSTPMESRRLDAAADPTSFDDGEDHGNLDGVLALPGPHGTCLPTLRLAALGRGQQDRALLELAAKCDPAATGALAKKMVPTALGDAPASGGPSWPTDEGEWEKARRELLRIAACTAR